MNQEIKTTTKKNCTRKETKIPPKKLASYIIYTLNLIFSEFRINTSQRYTILALVAIANGKETFQAYYKRIAKQFYATEQLEEEEQKIKEKRAKNSKKFNEENKISPPSTKEIARKINAIQGKAKLDGIDYIEVIRPSIEERSMRGKTPPLTFKLNIYTWAIQIIRIAYNNPIFTKTPFQAIDEEVKNKVQQLRENAKPLIEDFHEKENKRRHDQLLTIHGLKEISSALVDNFEDCKNLKELEEFYTEYSAIWSFFKTLADMVLARINFLTSQNGKETLSVRYTNNKPDSYNKDLEQTIEKEKNTVAPITFLKPKEEKAPVIQQKLFEDSNPATPKKKPLPILDVEPEKRDKKAPSEIRSFFDPVELPDSFEEDLVLEPEKEPETVSLFESILYDDKKMVVVKSDLSYSYENRVLDAESQINEFCSVGANKFRVVLVESETGKCVGNKEFNVSVLRSKLRELFERSDKEELHIFLTPLTDRKDVVFLQLDDVTMSNVQKIASYSFLTQETSPNSYHVWLAIKDDVSKKKSIKHRLIEALHTDARSPGFNTRLVGSRNFKYPQAYLVKMKGQYSTHKRTVSEDELLYNGVISSEEKFKSMAVSEALTVPLLDPFFFGASSQNVRFPLYSTELERAPLAVSEKRKALGLKDRSTADFRWSVIALGWGFKPIEVSDELKRISEKAQERKGNYAEKTVERAVLFCQKRGIDIG